MGRTQVEATVIRPESEGNYTFLVDTGSTYMGLPLEEIEGLGLDGMPGGRVEVLTAAGKLRSDSYAASVRIDGTTVPTVVLPTPIPLIGYEVLENLRLKVNPVTGGVEAGASRGTESSIPTVVSSPISRWPCPPPTLVRVRRELWNHPRE